MYGKKAFGYVLPLAPAFEVWKGLLDTYNRRQSLVAFGSTRLQIWI